MEERIYHQEAVSVPQPKNPGIGAVHCKILSVSRQYSLRHPGRTRGENQVREITILYSTQSFEDIVIRYRLTGGDERAPTHTPAVTGYQHGTFQLRQGFAAEKTGIVNSKKIRYGHQDSGAAAAQDIPGLPSLEARIQGH